MIIRYKIREPGAAIAVSGFCKNNYAIWILCVIITLFRKTGQNVVYGAADEMAAEI